MTLLDVDDRREMLAAVGGTVTIDGAPVTAVLTSESLAVDEVAGLWNDVVAMSVVAEDAASITLNASVINDNGSEYQAFEKQKPKDGFVVFFLTEDF